MSVDTSGLVAMVQDRSGDLIQRAGEAFVEAVRSHAPRRTGALADSVEAGEVQRSGTSASVRVTVGASYAVYVNEGTGIYGPEGQPIYPVNAQALAFDSPFGAIASGARRVTRRGSTTRVGSGMVVVAWVRGSEPTHFWERSIEAWPEIVGSLA